MLEPRPFLYLRHGETDWNLEHRAQGQADIPLNACGLAQARAARDLLAGWAVATVCTSPLRRAHDTARIVNEALGCPLVVIDALKEASWGAREGEVKGEWFAQWQRGAVPEGAEPLERFLARALGGINAALAHPGPVLIVAHGAVYWAIERFGRITREEAVPNGIPVHHDPPRPGRPWWTARPLA